MEKKFKAFDKVIVRDKDIFLKWTCDFYSHYDNDIKHHVTSTMTKLQDDDILPYEGNEHLVGTTDSPDEEVRLEEGDWVMASNVITRTPVHWILEQYDTIQEENSIETKRELRYRYAIRFKDFDPSNMEETKKHILCVKNGRIIRYK